MAEQEQTTGLVFTQSGAPVRASADYQRVYDSRWRFMEIEIERDFSVNLEARKPVDFSARYYERTTIIRHGLGFVPWFESTFENDGFGLGLLAPASIWADKDKIYLERFIITDGAEARAIELSLRIYNLPVLKNYEAPKGLPVGLSSPKSDIGIRFIDDQSRSVDLASRSPVGFSIDTKKKILSIHKHGLARINDWTHKFSQVTAINTSTDVLTVTEGSNPAATGWTQVAGTPVKYFPGDFATYPGGLDSRLTILSLTVAVR